MLLLLCRHASLERALLRDVRREHHDSLDLPVLRDRAELELEDRLPVPHFSGRELGERRPALEVDVERRVDPFAEGLSFDVGIRSFSEEEIADRPPLEITLRKEPRCLA
jgi:hypothetical protein